MSGRPEAGDGMGYDLGDSYDRDAWQEFTPWRPGDPPVADERPSAVAGDVGTVERGPIRNAHGSIQNAHEPDQGRRQAGDVEAEQPRRGWQWTEEQPQRYRQGDRVRATETTGGTFISHVPKGTEGRVVDTRLGALGGEYATVEFRNGYTEEVKTSDIERRSWW